MCPYRPGFFFWRPQRLETSSGRAGGLAPLCARPLDLWYTFGREDMLFRFAPPPHMDCPLLAVSPHGFVTVAGRVFANANGAGGPDPSPESFPPWSSTSTE